MVYVYLLTCADSETHIGCTENLREGLDRHYRGNVVATKDRLPVRLNVCFALDNKYTAYKFEKYLKSGSRRAFLKRHVFE